MTELTNEQIWERRFDVAIERFKGYDEYMDIPGYGVEPECPPSPILTDLEEYQENLEKRFKACKQRYQGIAEYMEIPDMDLWLRLKNEIIPKKPFPNLERHVCQTYLDEFQTISNGMNKVVCEFDPYLDEFQTVSMAMNSSDYVDDDRDDYSMDSIDKQERGYLRCKEKWLEYDD